MIKAIEVCGLRKSYGRTVALDGLDLSVAAGEVHGFLGPNGAGKTTTIRILLGMLRAGGGTARLLGGDPWRDAVPLHRRLAYVPGDVTLWPTLTGGEIIDLLGRLRGGLDPARRAGLIERFGLDPAKKARTYSTGNRQKVALIAALASDCELLILDEPTAGLDPLMEAVFRDCVQDERRRGRTVLLSSHILSEVEALCDRVTIIRAGKTVETGTLAQLRHLTRTAVTAELDTAPDLAGLAGLHAVTIEPSATTDPAGPDQAAAAPASASPDGASPDGASPASAGPASASPAASSGGAPPASASPAGGHPNGVAHGGAVRLACEVDAAGLGAVLARLVPAGVRSLVSRPPTLEELFLRHYAADPADAARLADADGPVGPDGPAEPAAPAGRGAPA